MNNCRTLRVSPSACLVAARLVFGRLSTCFASPQTNKNIPIRPSGNDAHASCTDKDGVDARNSRTSCGFA
eukprot:3521226-Pyramimonas_sp.AAC.1